MLLIGKKVNSILLCQYVDNQIIGISTTISNKIPFLGSSYSYTTFCNQKDFTTASPMVQVGSSSPTVQVSIVIKICT